MSFSRAPLKRFNEQVGCAPPPGSYEIKPGDPKGAASFDKSDRFKLVKGGASLLPPPPSPSRSILVSPVRRALSVDGLVDGCSAKKERNCMSLESKQLKLLEKEMRSLVQQRGEQDRRLVVLQEELKKVEAKLLVAVREKMGLTANLTSLERQRAELKKINEFLKNKVSADTTKKRINSLTMELMEAKNNLDVKNKELSVLQVNAEGQVNVLSTDLEVARSTVTALRDRSNDMEELHQVTKTTNEELENENARLHAEILELRQEVKAIQGYLDEANDQIQDLRLKLQEKADENKDVGSRIERIWQLEADIKQKNTEVQSVQDELKEKEEELQSSQKSASDKEEQIKLAEQQVQESQVIVHQQEAELVRLKEVLRRTEKELDERVAHLEQRCLFSEEQRRKTQEEGLRRVEELKNELIGVKETKREEKKRQFLFEQEHAKLTEELIKEKALVDSLSVLVEQEREDSEEQLRQLKDEMEEVLGELAVMENEEQRRHEVAEKSQEAFQAIQEENKELERQLSDTRERLESECQNLADLKVEHIAAMRKLQEERTNILSKMADLFTELQSVREELKGAEGREAEVERAIHRTEKELKQVVKQKEEEVRKKQEVIEEQQKKQLVEAKDREQNARLLLEVQTCLAKRDKEIKATEESHAAQINQLQQDLHLQTKEKEEALGRLEVQTGQTIAELEKAQDLSSLHDQVDLMEEKIQALGEQVQVLTQEKVTLQWDMEEQHQELQRKITEAQEKSSETDLWKQTYEELYANVKPFQEQLNAFAAERNALINENGANEEELNKLANAYARLLGHQNHKQKIKHVNNLKDENISLKQEVIKLRCQVSRQKTDLEQLKSKHPGAAHRRFDPSKAFQHDKENLRTNTSEPLKEGNHFF